MRTMDIPTYVASSTGNVASVTNFVRDAAVVGYASALSVALRAGLSPNYICSSPKYQNSLLSCAAALNFSPMPVTAAALEILWSGKLACVEMLLAAGADPCVMMTTSTGRCFASAYLRNAYLDRDSIPSPSLVLIGAVMSAAEVSPQLVETAKREVALGHNLDAVYARAYCLPSANATLACSVWQVLSGAGHSLSMYSIALAYQSGSGVSMSKFRAVTLLQQAADSGTKCALHDLACCFAEGDGVMRDALRAKELYLQGIAGGDFRCAYALAVMYEKGCGVPRDAARAVTLYLKAADAGIVDASFNLGNMFCDGVGVRKDVSRGVAFYVVAADAGLPCAQVNLGAHLSQGLGVPQDAVRAARLFELAIAQNDPSSLANAQANLGSLYASGTGVTYNMKKARQLWACAAASGHLAARLMLAQTAQM